MQHPDLINIKDRGLLYGHGVFSSILVDNGMPVNWNAHLDRFKNNCLMLHIHPPKIDYNDLINFIASNNAENGFWKLKIIATAGDARGPLAAGSLRDPRLIMLIEPTDFKHSSSYKLSVTKTARHPIISRCKSLSYLENILMLTEAKNSGLHDTLVCDQNGIVLETAIAGLFWVHDQVVYYPDFSLPLLPSTTVLHVVRNAKAIGLKSIAVKMPLESVPPDACWFAANALKGIIPITQIEGRSTMTDSHLTQTFQKIYPYTERVSKVGSV